MKPSSACKRPFLAAAILALTLLLVWRSAGLVLQDLAFSRVEIEVSFWGRGDYLPDDATVIGTGFELDKLLAGSPAQPGYLGLAANYYAWRSYWAPELAARQDYAQLAVAAQFKAQQSRPAYRQGWEKMVGYASQAAGSERWGRVAHERLVALQTGAGVPRGEPAGLDRQ